MHAFGERSTGRGRGRGSKRSRPTVPNGSATERQAAPLPDAQQLQNAHASLTVTPQNENLAPVSMSFESKIALALKGSSWQELQANNTDSAITAITESVQESSTLDTEVIEGEVDTQPEWTAKQLKKKANFDRNITRDAGDVIRTIESNSIIPVTQTVTWDQEPELLCSYNWQASNDGTNNIFVPGAPAKWEPRPLPYTLEPDSGFMFNDYNYARQRYNPYESMFQALKVMKPNYQFNDVDVLADRNNLRILLEFVQGKANGPFRLDLYSIYDTLVIVRNERKWWKNMTGGQSHGGNFEAFFTRPTEGMEDATSHYRAIRYPMGPLSVVVRFEADAYDNETVSDDLSPSEDHAVSGGLAEVPNFRFNAPVRVKEKGKIIPTAQMVELKTKAYREDTYDGNLVQCQDQLWFGRTSLLYTGRYISGTGQVTRIKYENAKERVTRWEESNQESLQKLVALLSQLKTIIKRERRPNHAVILVRDEKAGPLSVRTLETTNRAVGLEAFRRHWVRDPMHSGNNRGRGYRGGGAYHLNLRGGRGVHPVQQAGRETSFATRGHGQAHADRRGGGLSHAPMRGSPEFRRDSTAGQG